MCPVARIRRFRSIAASLVVAYGLLSPCGAVAETNASIQALQDSLPLRLADTGLYAPGTDRVRPDILSFTPQYPLWSDGATKRRWIYLPPGTSIDGSDFDAWDFPTGTRLWKEFGHGRPIETRFIERRADGSWRYAAYVWNAEGSDAELAPVEGLVALPADGAPGGRYSIPSQNDCRACHEGAAVPVLGMSALQLSADRDPLAPNVEAKKDQDIDLGLLFEAGLLRNVPAAQRDRQPRIEAVSPEARAAFGYLHANCGHCHNSRGPLADVGLVLAQDAGDGWRGSSLLDTTIGVDADSSVNGLTTRVVAGSPQSSQLLARMKSRNPMHQMPPLGTYLADEAGVAIVEQWIQQLDHQRKTSHENIALL